MRPRNEREWLDLLDWAKNHSVGDHIRTAIEERA